MNLEEIKTFTSATADMLKELVTEGKLTAEDARIIAPEIIKSKLNKEVITIN